MKVKVLHPIVHDGTEYARGVHELPQELANLFLTYRHAAEPYEEPVVARAKEDSAKPAKK